MQKIAVLNFPSIDYSHQIDENDDFLIFFMKLFLLTSKNESVEEKNIRAIA
ncbi:hypothetical protein QUF75_12420 [Desulfococcaceae bacterium HSG7]|nr:hypothetical protein [Desulfococcaceae bacterium HSG7]